MGSHGLQSGIQWRSTDWKGRRNELLRLSCPTIFDLIQIKVLTFLINRYGESTVAITPAGSPRGDRVSLNRRWIVVHAHMSRERRRLTTRGTWDDQINVESDLPLYNQPNITAIAVWTLLQIRRTLKNWFRRWSNWGTARQGSDRWLRNRCEISGKLPRTYVKQLVSRLADVRTDDMAALEILGRCTQEDFYRESMRLWRIRVLADRDHDRVLSGLETRICEISNAAKTAEAMREFLGDDPPELRVAALRIMERVGNLDDLVLMADLLNLPAEDLSPEEPSAMIKAMRVIADRCVETNEHDEFKRWTGD